MAAAVVAGALTGCGGLDKDRTATEGALLGTATGAVIGAGVGYLLHGGPGAGYGAAIGGAGGLVGGAIVGQHVARRKEQFAKAADYMDACIAAAYTTDQQLILHNRSLSAHLTELDSEIAESLRTDPEELAAQAAGHQRTIVADLRAADAQLARVRDEITIQSAVLESERPTQPQDRVQRLENEIESLEQRKSELEEMIRQLRAMDNRMLASQ